METVVVIAILIVVIGALVSSIRFFYRSNAHALEQSFAIHSARIGIERMVKDTREAAFSDQGGYPVISMATSSFSFYSDIDEDIFVEKIRCSGLYGITSSIKYLFSNYRLNNSYI